MPYTVEAAFEQFRENIELSGNYRDIAEQRRDHLVSLLEGGFEILEAFPTGSIPRYTAVKEHADLDVMVVLHCGKHAKDRKPSQVLLSVRDYLARQKRQTEVRRNGQAVTLYYETWPSVDVVPVFKTTSGEELRYYNVPDMHREVWLVSRPWVHDREMTEHNTNTCGERFKRLVKMFKWWNYEHGALLQSFHIEVMALQTFTGSLDEYSWNAYSMFEKAHALASSTLYHNGDLVDGYLSAATRQQVLEKLKAAMDKSRSAWILTYGGRNDHEQAITLWRQVFGDEFPSYG